MNEDIRILEVITVPFEKNGLAMFAVNILEAMDRTGIEVGFAAPGDGDPELIARIQRLNSKYYPLPGRLRHPVGYFTHLRKIIREGDYKIVHVHGNSCTMALDLWAAKSGGAVRRLAHSHNTSCKYKFLHRLLRKAFDGMYTEGLACGREAGEWLFAGKSFTVMGNAVDIDRFAFSATKRVRLREAYGLKDELAIGCVAHFGAEKNQLFLLKAFAEAGRGKLFFVGDGPLRGAAEAFANEKELGDRVKFLGRISALDMPDYLSAMDLMALPSLHEGFPTVVLEWQCSGLPALVSYAVTHDCAIASGVDFLKLEENAWVKAIRNAEAVDRENASLRGRAALANAGRDISDSASKMKAIYLQE